MYDEKMLGSPVQDGVCSPAWLTILCFRAGTCNELWEKVELSLTLPELLQKPLQDEYKQIPGYRGLTAEFILGHPQSQFQYCPSWVFRLWSAIQPGCDCVLVKETPPNLRTDCRKLNNFPLFWGHIGFSISASSPSRIYFFQAKKFHMIFAQ